MQMGNNFPSFMYLGQTMQLSFNLSSDEIAKNKATYNFTLKYNGPIVSFNILRHDGTYVGCSEVAKLATLSIPPIQFRTGCFCNPGGCQDALGILDEQVLENGD